MPSTVEELTKNHVKLTIEVPFSDLKPHLDKAYKAIASQITVPGFRKGHVPQAIIDQRIGRQAVMQEALNEILPEAYGKALEEHSIVPMSDPAIEVTTMESGKDVVFTAELDKRPDFTLPTMSDIKVEVEALKETDDAQVEERIDMLRQRFATRAEVDRAAAKGDAVLIDLKGSKDGEELPEATAQDVAYTIGDEGMLEGLEEAVTGLKVGESKTFESELVGGPLKGTKAEIEVTVKKVQEVTLPELDDEFAQLVSEFDTVDEMKADLKKAVAQMAAYDQAADARDKALEAIVEATAIELPEGVLDREVANRKQSVEQQLAQMGMKLDDYLEQVEEGKSADEFWAELEKNTGTAIKAQLILDKMAEESEIELDQNDLTQHLIRRAQMGGTSPEQELQHMMEHNHMQEWIGEIRRNKALDAMMADVTVTDVNGKKVDLSILNPNADPAIEDDADEDDADEVEAEAPAEEKKPAKKAPAKKAAKKADEAEEKPAKKAAAKKSANKKAEAEEK